MLFYKGNQTCSGMSQAEGGSWRSKKHSIAGQPNREANLREANERLDPVRENELEELIKQLRKEKEETESRLRSDKERLEKRLNEHKKTEVTLKRKIENLTKAMEASHKKKNKAMVTKNNNLMSKTKAVGCEASERDERKTEVKRLCTELGQFRKEEQSLKIENADYLREIKDLEKQIKVLELENKSLLSKIKTEKCEKCECDKVKAELNRLSTETERLRKEDNSLKKKNADFLQKINDLETKNSSLELKIKELKSSIAKADAKTADLEKNVKALEKKNERFRKKLPGTKECDNCKMLDVEVNKYKKAVNRKY